MGSLSFYIFIYISCVYLGFLVYFEQKEQHLFWQVSTVQEEFSLVICCFFGFFSQKADAFIKHTRMSGLLIPEYWTQSGQTVVYSIDYSLVYLFTAFLPGVHMEEHATKAHEIRQTHK